MQNKLNAMQKKKLSQKYDPPPEKKKTTRDKDRIEIQSPPKRTHGIIVKKKTINLKTLMPNVGYAFEYFHCYNEIQTILTTCLCTAWGPDCWIASNLKLLLTATDLSDWQEFLNAPPDSIRNVQNIYEFVFNAVYLQQSKGARICYPGRMCSQRRERRAEL